MAVFRIEKIRDYTFMSNYHLRDRSLSLKAKGLLSLMLSLPEDWDYTMKGLARICKDGIGSISGGIRELEKAREHAERTQPEKKPSIRKRLAAAKQECARQQPRPAPEKKPPELGEL